MQKKIVFDIDGVMTEGKYLAPKERTFEGYMNLKPIEGVIKLLNELKEAGFDLYVISSRELLLNHTCFDNWLKKINSKVLFKDFKELNFNIPPKNKAELAQSLDCAVLVDDSIDAIRECNNTAVKGFLFIDQVNRRYKTEDYVKFRGTEIVVTDEHSLRNELQSYLKEAGIVF